MFFGLEKCIVQLEAKIKGFSVSIRKIGDFVKMIDD